MCIFLGIQRFREGRKFIKNVPSTKAGKTNSSLSLFFFNLNCVTGEILSQGESVPEPSLGLGKIFQHVRNEADGPLRRKKRKKKSAGGKRKAGKAPGFRQSFAFQTGPQLRDPRKLPLKGGCGNAPWAPSPSAHFLFCPWTFKPKLTKHPFPWNQVLA